MPLKALAAFAVLATIILVGCGSESSSNLEINGAGSTFAAPVVGKWCREFESNNENVRVLYDAVGSGSGESQFLEGKVDFAATDAGLSDEKLASVSRGAIQVPLTAGIIVLAYNATDLPADIHLPREVYADVFLGKSIRWDDPRIVAANPNKQLPNKKIVPVVRGDSSGTTFALTNHLAAVSEEWRKTYGNPDADDSSDQTELGVKSVDWPTEFTQGTGNSEVAKAIKDEPFALGYVQYGAARDIGLPMAWPENRAGNFIRPSAGSGLETLLEATLPENLVGYFPDPDGDNAYPIVTFTWLLAYKKYDDPKRAEMVKKFVLFCLGPGQDFSEAAGNVRLAPNVARVAEKMVESELEVPSN